MAKESIVMSLGGSIIVPKEINISFLKKFKKLILKHSKNKRIVIVCGGGKTARNYMDSTKKITKTNNFDLDLVGIKATKINAELVRSIFGKNAHKEVIENPNKKINTRKNIIIASGWIPGFSSDMDAVLLAKQLKAKTVINLSNISYVYTKDPNKFKTAKKIEKINWKEFLNIIGTKFIPGTSWPFDPIASKLAKKLNLEVIIAKGTDLNNLNNILNKRKFKGTLIK